MKKYVAIINNEFTINDNGEGSCYYKECGLSEVRETLYECPLVYFNESSTLEDVEKALIENNIVDEEIDASDIENIKLILLYEFLNKIPEDDRYETEIILK